VLPSDSEATVSSAVVIAAVIDIATVAVVATVATDIATVAFVVTAIAIDVVAVVAVAVAAASPSRRRERRGDQRVPRRRDQEQARDAVRSHDGRHVPHVVGRAPRDDDGRHTTQERNEDLEHGVHETERRTGAAHVGVGEREGFSGPANPRKRPRLGSDDELALARRTRGEDGVAPGAVRVIKTAAVVAGAGAGAGAVAVCGDSAAAAAPPLSRVSPHYTVVVTTADRVDVSCGQ
jgi:hypothetical protein